MRIALISDVHANLHALEAVCADAQVRGCTAMWDLGDRTGYGAFPDEVVQRLGTDRSAGVIGNYDVKVLSFCPGSIGRARPKNPTKLFAFRWAYHQLSSQGRRILARLGRQQCLELAGRRVLMTHAGPGRPDHVVTPDTPDEALAELAAEVDADILLSGHSHRQVDRTVNGVRFINPGAVGRPEGGDPRACYAVLTADGDALDLEFVRLEYDWTAAAEAIRRKGLPEVFAQMVLHGHNFDEATDRLARHVAAEAVKRAAPEVGRARQLAERCAYEVEHAQQVSFLALRLFDLLQPLHGMGLRQRTWLHCAGILHDIGWMYGQRKHHKNSMKLILDADDVLADRRERRIVSSIARYHRRALPRDDHEHYASLQAGDRHTVRMLGGILRLADGLDRTHQDAVEDISCAMAGTRLVLRVHGRGVVDGEIEAGRRKSILLAKAFHRQVVITPDL